MSSYFPIEFLILKFIWITYTLYAFYFRNSFKISIQFNTSQVSRARLQGTAQKESRGWLNALPVSSLGTLLDSESFRVAIALTVGADICIPHSCRWGAGRWTVGVYMACPANKEQAAFQDIRQWMMWLRERFKKPAYHRFWSLLG